MERILNRNLHRLASALDPTTTATVLYGDGIIQQNAWDEARLPGPTYDRNLKVLEALKKTIHEDESAWEKFLAYLAGESVYEKLVVDLRAQMVQAIQQQAPTLALKPPNSHRRLFPKDDLVDDATMMAIARDVGPKWEEVGVALGLDYAVLVNEVASQPAKGEHMKAFHMLQQCRSRDEDGFTYTTLAGALEECGLKSSARKHCFKAA